MDIHGLYDLARREVVVPKGCVSDLGDLRHRTQDSDDAYLSLVSDAMRVLVTEGKLPLLLGGDHLVTLAALRGISRAGRRIQVVQIDAHHDYEPITADDRPHHGSFIGHVVREGLTASVTQLGVRGLTWGEHPAPEGVRQVRLEALRESLLPGVDVYLTIDTDGFDPSVAGAVGFPEPDGLAFSALAEVLRQIDRAGLRLMGADWTEYNPAFDTANALTARTVVRGLAALLVALAGQPSVEGEVQHDA